MPKDIPPIPGSNTPPPADFDALLESLKIKLRDVVDYTHVQGAAFLNETAWTINYGAVLTAQGNDPQYVAMHVRARLVQLAALHLDDLDRKARHAAIDVVVTSLSGLIGLLPAKPVEPPPPAGLKAVMRGVPTTSAGIPTIPPAKPRPHVVGRGLPPTFLPR